MLIGAVANRGLLGLLTRRSPGVPTEPADAVEAAGGYTSLVALTATAQVGAFTDVLVVRSVAGAFVAGEYRAGVQVPTQLIGLLFRAFDVAYPRLAVATAAEAAAFLATWSARWGLVAGAALGVTAAARNPLVSLLLGRPDAVAADVLVLFCLVWLANYTVHGLALYFIATGRHPVLTRVVLLEYAANLAATLILVPAYGARGSAVATLVTLTICNVVVLPRLLRKGFGAAVTIALRSSLLPALGAFAVADGLTTALLRVAG
ncbi:MAG: hypothetical protein NVSMB13_19910 [Mycobacteriales bacterium]